MKHCAAAAAYLNACNREHADCALELVNALNQSEREVHLSQRVQPLVDIDVVCIAEALRAKHSLRVLNLEENQFGQLGLQSLVEAMAANPNLVRELRLGKNKLKDGAVAMLGNFLAVSGVGLKVLDLSENGITKIGVMPICQGIAGRYSELVELSLHNNQLESDCALPLAQAVRQSTKLRHLHLGYNNLREGGAIQLARCLPVAASLSTLDLTANHIGPQGGLELCKALLNGSCTLQRLNLRNNELNDDALLMFADVIARNTSLTNLFLGYMEPSPPVAATVLAALRQNRTLLLFDCYGWKFDLRTVQSVLEGVLESNSTLRAVISDAFQPLFAKIDKLNAQRDQRSLHPIYIGPDDRHANQAASVRIDRARSIKSPSTFRQQEPSQQQQQTAAVPAAVPRATSPETSSANLFAEKRQSTSSAAGSRRGTQQTASQQQQPPQRAYSPIARSGSSFGHEQPSAAAGGGSEATLDADLDAMMGEFERVNCEPELRNRLLLIISQLQLKMEIQRSYQQQQIVALEERVRVLEHANRVAPPATSTGSAPRPVSSSYSANPIDGLVFAASASQGRGSVKSQIQATDRSARSGSGYNNSTGNAATQREPSPTPTSATVAPIPTSRPTVLAVKSNQVSSVPPRAPSLDRTQSPDRGPMALSVSSQQQQQQQQQRVINFSGNNAPQSQQRTTSPSPYIERSGSEPRPSTAVLQDPPNHPKNILEPSPLQPDLQQSQQVKPFTSKLDATPKKQEQVFRKQPPKSA